MAAKKIVKNYIYNVAYEILAIIIPLITTPYLSRVLGAENIGIYSYSLSIATYFILFGSLGIALYGKREIAYVQDDIDKRSRAFFEVFITKCITMLISITLFYFSFCINGEYDAYYKILLLEMLANILDISWLFQGLEEFKKTVVRNVIIKAVSVACIFLFVKSESDLGLYFAIYVLSNLIGNISLWLYLPKYIKRQKLKSLNVKKHIKPMLVLFVPQVATQIYTVLDKVMIGAIIPDKSEVGYYEQSQKIVKMLLTLATALGTVMMPRIAATYAKKEMARVKEYMNKSFSFIAMLAFPLMMGIISISYHFVPVFYGDGYEKVRILLCAISPIIVLIGFSNVVGTQYLLPTKQQAKYTISVIVGAATNFLFNLLLINNLASIGASIATVIAEFSVTAAQLYLVRKELKVTDIIKNTYRYLISSLIMLACGLTISSLIEDNITSLVVQVAVSVMVYFGVLLVLRDPMVKEGYSIAREKIFRK